MTTEKRIIPANIGVLVKDQYRFEPDKKPVVLSWGRASHYLTRWVFPFADTVAGYARLATVLKEANAAEGPAFCMYQSGLLSGVSEFPVSAVQVVTHESLWERYSEKSKANQLVGDFYLFEDQHVRNGFIEPHPFGVRIVYRAREYDCEVLT